MKRILAIGILGSSLLWAEGLVITGRVLDTRGEPVSEAKVKLTLKGEELAEAEANSDGGYIIKAEIEDFSDGLSLEIEKPCFSKGVYRLSSEDFAKKDGSYYLYTEKTLDRKIMAGFWVALGILLLYYIFIVLNLLHITQAAFLGASLMLFVSYTLGKFNSDFFILSFGRAVSAIDFNVIFLLMGMMIIVGIMKETGVFQWMAYKSYSLAKGKIWVLVVILMWVTAIASAFLDNVTAILLLAPVTIEIALVLGLSPLILLIPEILASNIGGTATLIGDPPNIMIGSYAHLTFNDFIMNLTPIVVVAMFALTGLVKLFYGKEYEKARVENVDGLLARLRQEYKITDMKLLKYCLFILAFTISLFIIHGKLHMEPAIAAMIGSSILLFISKVNVVKIVEDVEWLTLVFFMMLFIMVAGVEETGFIQMVAGTIKGISSGNLTLTILLVLWVSAIISTIIGNISCTVAMLSIVAYLTAEICPGSNILWWALALGACFGGNCTLIGAPANIVTAGLSEKAGHPISFLEFTKKGAPITFVTIILCSIYLLVFLK
ncbi:citrate transporter [bacterium]|nr:citrate transporter [bacterium]MBU1599423.1 citrate transporter [bacterium]